jgi:hypothetical protein
VAEGAAITKSNKGGKWWGGRGAGSGQREGELREGRRDCERGPRRGADGAGNGRWDVRGGQGTGGCMRDGIFGCFALHWRRIRIDIGMDRGVWRFRSRHGTYLVSG